MELIFRVYIWGILAALLVQFIAIMLYSFDSDERSTYEANLNKVDLSRDPLKLKVYPSSEFKHTALRFWKHIFFGLLGSLLSWYEVLAKMYRIMKLREVKSMLTAEQKQAAFILTNNPRLSKEEVIEKLKILDPDLLTIFGKEAGEEVDDEEEEDEENLGDTVNPK